MIWKRFKMYYIYLIDIHERQLEMRKKKTEKFHMQLDLFYDNLISFNKLTSELFDFITLSIATIQNSFLQIQEVTFLLVKLNCRRVIFNFSELF